MHFILFKAQVFLHYCKHCNVSSLAIDLRRHSLIIREQQEVEIESLTTQLCASSMPRGFNATENQCRCQQVKAQGRDVTSSVNDPRSKKKRMCLVSNMQEVEIESLAGVLTNKA